MSSDDKKKMNALIQFGNIRSRGGAIFLVKGWRDIAQVKVEAAKVRIQQKGYEITPEIEARLNELAEADAKKCEEEFRVQGVPQNFRHLFSLQKKSEVVKYIKNLTITGNELALLIHNCEQIGLKHERQHFQYVPAQLKATEKEKEAFFSNGVGKFKTKESKTFFNKIKATFTQRKNVSAHLFENDNGWHLFWLTYDDAYGTRHGGKNHWEGGDHIHYASHLWGHEKEKAWDLLKSKEYAIRGVHIRYKHDTESEESA